MDWRELGVQGSKKKEPSLESTRKALDKLGNPDKDYEVILVGGTNGKGSTVEMISELLQEKGNKVGVNKSPHLEKPHERIKVNSEEISEKNFGKLVEEINALDLELSFFEFITVMAFEHFSSEEVDYAVMEVGMGGRLDATNAADNRIATITNIDKDHGKYLGETLEDIANEKAGIVPENGITVSGSENEIIRKISRKRNSSFRKPADIQKFNGDIFYRGEVFELPVKGDFQIENLSVALKTVSVLGETPENIGKAIEKIECRGRLEKISEKPLTVVDGAHNPSAIRRVKEEIPEKFICVFNCTKTKNSELMIEELEEKAFEIIFTESKVEWSEDPSELQKMADGRTRVIKNSSEALKIARDTAGREGSVFVTGSLYLIGELLSQQNQ